MPAPNEEVSPKPDADYVHVRRPVDAPFRVISEDLVSDETPGYDLSLVRSLAREGLVDPISVSPLPGSRFKVVDGLKRLAAIRFLVRTNKLVYDALWGIMRPAKRVFALLNCRIPVTPKDARGAEDGAKSKTPHPHE